MPDIKETNEQPTAKQEEGQNERARRMRALKKGKLIFNRGLRSVPCIVRNLSETGAKLEFEQAYLLPHEFVLQIDLEDFEVTCERRWEDGLRCGVEFTSEKRSVGKLRAQILKSSDEALKEEIDELRDSPDNYFSRKRVLDAQKQSAHEQPTRTARPSASSKPGFGRRR
ncbi:PilZ domain-containing protein [Roseibium sp. HPY-6]|uniref:PilZ domain-containing protein n=1 Tax=Roseibium sp. HPY-6 TaxID=3229852 RepID=UPI00338EC5EF